MFRQYSQVSLIRVSMHWIARDFFLSFVHSLFNSSEPRVASRLHLVYCQRSNHNLRRVFLLRILTESNDIQIITDDLVVAH